MLDHHSIFNINHLALKKGDSNHIICNSDPITLPVLKIVVFNPFKYFKLTQEKKVQIDLEKVIRDKNPRLLKVLPRFILRYLKKIIHQEEFNSFLELTKNDYEHEFIRAALDYFQIEVLSIGRENIPEKGGCIVVCNHPLGGIDGIAVMNEVGKVRKDIKALVNDLLMNLENLSTLLIPINKHGKNMTENLKRIDRVYASDECLIIFPAGMVSRKQNGIVKDLDWKKSVVTKAVKYQHDIIPVYVEARNSNFFYNLGLIRKKLRVKANLEMFYLVDEVYKQKGKTIRLTIGRPIPYSLFTKELTAQQWTNKLKEHVYGLKTNSNQLLVKK